MAPEELDLIGKELVAQGRACPLFLAGGQGTRLGLDAPKGTYPITLKKKSLFQLYSEKILACEKLVQREIPVLFMTSPENHEETSFFFKKNNFFGLKESQVHFFMQSTLAILDEQDAPVLDSQGKAISYADGNGSLFWSLEKNGLLKKLKKLGIYALNVTTIDNPLNDPLDFGFIGRHFQHQNDATIKAIKRIDPFEKVGVIMEKDKKLTVVEYSELSDSEKMALDEKGEFVHKRANISSFCFSLNFIEKAVQHPLSQMPLHKAKKAKNGGASYFKFEYFIFDVLQFADKVEVVLQEREKCFSPLKNKEGDHSPKTVQEALLKRDRQIFAEISGKKVPEDILFELPQEFYYPTEELKNSWKGKDLPSDFQENIDS